MKTKMDKQQKARLLLQRLDKLERDKQIRARGGNVLLNDAVEEMTAADLEPRTNPTARALQEIDRELADIKTDPRLDQVFEDLKKAGEETDSKFDEANSVLEEGLTGIAAGLKNLEDKSKELTLTAVGELRDRLISVLREYHDVTERLREEDQSLQGEIDAVKSHVSSIRDELARRIDAFPALFEPRDAEIAETKQSSQDLSISLEELRKELNNRINNMPHGGNMNRSILVGGDKDTLSKFTDINLKAGAGTTISYSANQTTQYTDITITATGAGAGITRSVNSISSDTAAGATASVDYVYIVTGTTTLTLPTAVGNTNLYTVKNTGSGVVSIATTGGQTIDGAASPLQLVTQYTSVDLISNGSNWDIT